MNDPVEEIELVFKSVYAPQGQEGSVTFTVCGYQETWAGEAEVMFTSNVKGDQVTSFLAPDDADSLGRILIRAARKACNPLETP